MESDIRCAILSNRTAKSKIPDAGVVFAPLFWSEFDARTDLDGHTLCNSLRKAMKVEGIAESNTDRDSTIPMSSSSDKCASLAASRSSFAMPNETENARSDPREPIAPAIKDPSSDSNNYSIFSAELKAASREVCFLPSAIASQRGISLPLRRLLITPNMETAVCGRGGKALRHRTGRTHSHYYSGSIFGCLLGAAVQFARKSDDRVSDVMRSMHSCLQPAGKDVMSCGGDDAYHLQRGFASHHVIHGQLVHLPESKGLARIDSRYGKKSVVLGISACMYFVLYCLKEKTDNSASISFAAARWLKYSHEILSNWRCPAQSYGACQYEALQAERRALERGMRGLKKAKDDAIKLGMDTYNTVRLELEYMRKAMWPPNRRLDAASQRALLAWIDTESFERGVEAPLITRPKLEIAVNVPLSAVNTLDKKCGDGDNDNSSVCDSMSSETSCGSLSSVASEDLDAMNALNLMFGNHI